MSMVMNKIKIKKTGDTLPGRSHTPRPRRRRDTGGPVDKYYLALRSTRFTTRPWDDNGGGAESRATD